MAQFVYKAITPTGEQLEGQLEAGSEAEVIAKIQEAGNIPVQARELKTGFSLENLLASRKKSAPSKSASLPSSFQPYSTPVCP